MAKAPNPKCPYPVMKGAGICCGDEPCTVTWRRVCDDQGGCVDRSACGGCDEPVFKKDPTDA